MIRLLLLVCALCTGYAQAAKTHPVLTCRLGATAQAELLADERGPEGSALFIKIGNITTPAFEDFSNYEFIGELAYALCQNGVLVFGLNYGPPYIKGVALRLNARSNQIEKIAFSEKSRPSLVYSGSRDMQVIFSNAGHETDKKYIVYRSGTNAQDPTNPSYMNSLPSPASYQVIRLPGETPVHGQAKR